MWKKSTQYLMITSVEIPITGEKFGPFIPFLFGMKNTSLKDKNIV